MVNPLQVDMAALHSTRAGRFLDALTLGASVAVPDYVPKGGGRHTLAQTLIVVAGSGAASMIHPATSRPNYQEFVDLYRGLPANKAGNAWALIGVGVGVTALGAWGLERGSQALADRLRQRGVNYPFTLFGTLAAAGLFALLEVDHRHNTAKEDVDV